MRLVSRVAFVPSCMRTLVVMLSFVAVFMMFVMSVMMFRIVRVVIRIIVDSREDAFRNHGVACMVHISVLGVASFMFSRTLALKLLPPGGLFGAVTTIATKLAYGMAFAFTVIELPVVVALPLVGDGYGSKCRGEKCRSQTHVEREKRIL